MRTSLIGPGFRKVALRSLLIVTLVVLMTSVALSKPQRDFIEYWTVSHVFVSGGNAYSLPEVFRLERPLNWPEPVPLMVLNPPWILPLIAPLGFLQSYALGWLLWIFLLATALCVSSTVLMDLYAADVRLRDVSDRRVTRALFVFSFFPTIVSLRFAQIAGLMLLGIAGFLWLFKKGYPALAGSALVLAALKPQLVYLVFVTLAVTAMWHRAWRPMVGFLASIALLSGVAWAVDPLVFRCYYELASGPYVQLYPSAVGAILRFPFGSANTFHLQFVPPLFGMVWLVFFLRGRLENWSWLDAMPALVTASVLTAPYGWLFDQAILTIAVVTLFADSVRAHGRISRKLFWLYALLNLGSIFASLAQSFVLFYAVCPTVFLVLLARQARQRTGVLQQGNCSSSPL